MSHAFVTITIPFSASNRAAVEQYLDGNFGNPASPALRKKLDEASFAHFMSISVMPEDKGEQRCHLIIEVNADGTEADACAKLATTIGSELGLLFSVAGINQGSDLAGFLRRNHHGVGQGYFATAGVNFDGTPELAVGQVRREAELAHDIGDMLDEVRGATALDTLEQVRNRLWDDESRKWAFAPAPAPSLTPPPPVFPGLLAAVGSVAATFLWPFLLLLLAVLVVVWILAGFATAAWVTAIVLAAELIFGAWFYSRLRKAEDADIPDDIAPPADQIAEYMRREGHAAQSHLAAYSQMKPGWLRGATLKMGLWFAGVLAKYFSQPGFLGETGVIHFARWILVPGTDKLVFFSNYDGVWESYLEDFIERAKEGVTGIWSNTRGFPRTENLILKGAGDGDRLRRWTRRQQMVSWFWYTGYPAVSLNRIRTNSAIRQGISQAKSEAEAADWLACFGAEPRPAWRLETPEIPTLIFGGLGNLPHSCCLLVRFGSNPGAGKKWLAAIEEKLSFGDGAGVEEAMLVAVSRTGLPKLGVADLASFPLAFQHGSAAPWRAKALGDVERNDPSKWAWGGPNDEVDAILLLYAMDEAAIAKSAGERAAEAESFGHKVKVEVSMTPLGPRDARVRVKEPFGFADGISQPRIRGTVTARGTAEIHLVEAGEFLLGYPDNLGYLPPSPCVPAGSDPKNILPALGDDPLRSRPNFVPPQPEGQHDLGRNGTFLVVRQLEQDKAGFAKFVDDTASQLGGAVPPILGATVQEWVAAKLVGRWRDGSSLARNPHGPATERAKRSTHPSAPQPPPDNEFLYGDADPTGLRCPLGAHIRRANPRDTFSPGSAKQLAITNRHRILRVGRPYASARLDGERKPEGAPQPADATDAKGIMFMCLNIDIDRQFGFIQQTWTMAPSFHGLENEVDAFVGSTPHRGQFTIPMPNGPLRLKGMTDFVTVKGSAYFFLPGRRAVQYLAAG